MSLEQNLIEMERKRELYWLRYPSHLAYETALESAYDAPLLSYCAWRVHLANSVREAVSGPSIFHPSCTEKILLPPLSSMKTYARQQPNAICRILRSSLRRNLIEDYPPESFDYVVGTAILCHTLYSRNLAAIYKLLKPGGQLLFFEANFWNPQVFLKGVVPPLGRRMGNAQCQIGMRKYELLKAASHQGFSHVDIISL